MLSVQGTSTRPMAATASANKMECTVKIKLRAMTSGTHHACVML